MQKVNEERYREISFLLGKIRKCEDGSGRTDSIAGSRDVAQVAVKVLATAVNDFTFDSRAFIQEFKAQHKTLQQNMFRVFMALVKAMSEEESSIDGRNAASYRVARAINDAGYCNIPLPFI